MPYLGEIAALATAACWAFTSIFFSRAGSLIGSFKVNKIRLLMAVVIYTLILGLIEQRLFPIGISTDAIAWLALSGVIGLTIGDGMLFKAFVMIGPRLTTLIYATSPIFAAIVAWTFLGERLGLLDMIGIVVTLSGVAWVVAERKYDSASRGIASDHPDSGSMLKGVLYGLGGAAGQGVGLVIAKHGMLDCGIEVPAMNASFIRMLAAATIIWTVAVLRGQLGGTAAAIKNRTAMAYSMGGAIFGPFMGVSLSLVAVALISAGVAATLNAMVPVMILPLVVWLDKEKLSIRAIFGTLVAVAGVAILFLSETTCRLRSVRYQARSDNRVRL
jgi:drug/metabolite transporter (DMT)-like permease